MNLQEISQKIKSLPELPKDIFVVLLIILTGISGYMIGRLEEREGKAGKKEVILTQAAGVIVPGNPVVAAKNEGSASTSASPISISSVGQGNQVSGVYVGSRGGRAYHLPSCPGARKIKEENKIWFQTKEEAVAKGYSPAGNCPQLLSPR